MDVFDKEITKGKCKACGKVVDASRIKLSDADPTKLTKGLYSRRHRCVGRAVRQEIPVERPE